MYIYYMYIYIHTHIYSVFPGGQDNPSSPKIVGFVSDNKVNPQTLSLTINPSSHPKLIELP